MRVKLDENSNLRFPKVLGLSDEKCAELYAHVLKHLVVIIVASFTENHVKAEYALNMFFEDIEDNFNETERIFMLMVFGDASEDIEDKYGEKLNEMAKEVSKWDDEDWYSKFTDTFEVKSTTIKKDDLFSIIKN